MKKQPSKKQQLKLMVSMASFFLTLIIFASSFSIAQEMRDTWKKPPKTPGEELQKTPTHELKIAPSAFKTQGGNEFILDTRYNVIVGLPIREEREKGVDLTKYDLEFTFKNANGRQIQLWYKNSSWRNVYSYPYTIQKEQSIRYNPFNDGRNVDEFNDFSHIYAIGAKVFDGLKNIQIISVKLIRRD